jgi:putative flippase GtrA
MNSSMRKLILYVFIGIAAAFLDFWVFYALSRAFGLNLLLANTSGVCSGNCIFLLRESQTEF